MEEDQSSLDFDLDEQEGAAGIQKSSPLAAQGTIVR